MIEPSVAKYDDWFSATNVDDSTRKKGLFFLWFSCFPVLLGDEVLVDEDWIGSDWIGYEPCFLWESLFEEKS